MERELFKAQNLLNVSGLAVIAFGLWSILKTVLTLIFYFDRILDGMDSVPSADLNLVKTIVWVVAAVMMLVSLLLRCFIGLSARAAGQGKKKGNAYLVFTVILILFSIASLVVLLSGPKDSGIVDLVVQVLVELTSLFAMLEVLVNGIRVKKLSKELAQTFENGSVPAQMEKE